MEISEEARKMLDNKVAKIMKRLDVPENLKTDIARELISDYTGSSMRSAELRGAAVVERSDVDAAIRTSDDPEDLASMYMASYVNSLKKAGIVSRSIAFVIDFILVNVCAIIVSLPFILLGEFLIPSGDIPLHLFLRFYYVIIIAQLTVIFVYFAIFEGYYGYTPGKRLLGLKVLKTDGRKAGYGEAMLRSIPKLFILAILADALLMVMLYRHDRQRLFDKVAGTMVIHRNKS
jgi:uncharacterized RDD family membrane protein YckC